ncbi:MAG: J domain-containing protein, partial [Treponema sp.]|nr:J domain-containing protein [Treponema sp.]
RTDINSNKNTLTKKNISLFKNKKVSFSKKNVNKKNINIDKSKKKASVIRTYSAIPHTSLIHKEIPIDILKAYNSLGLQYGASEKEITEAYHSKLKMYHPDNKSSNEIVQKVANNKTEEIISAYNTIKKFLNKQ